MDANSGLERRSGRLPPQPNPLIGRAAESAAIEALLVDADVRLLTLTGPAGCGKTRLALHVAGQVEAHFAHGVWFVDLAPVREPDQVVATIAAVLGLAAKTPVQPQLDMLIDAVRDWHALFVLDNFEQVVESAPRIAQLLANAPRSTMLITSREPLHLSWEREFPVAPLAAPDLTPSADVQTVARSPAVQLFVQRARASQPDWSLNPTNARSVAELCLRLDCLPLAIELAAARIKFFGPEAMLARLERRLDLLNSGRRDQPERHQGLRDAIAWSYELLTPAEQVVFRRAGIFAGGWELGAADELCLPSPANGAGATDYLAALVDKNLVRQEPRPDGEPRFLMLETIGGFARNRLEEDGELTAMQLRHAQWCVRLAEEASPALGGPRQVEWLERLEREHDNLRSALHWSLHGGDVLVGLRLAAALGRFWEIHGHVYEAERWIEALLPARSRAEPAVRARLCSVGGHLAFLRSDYARAEALHQESLTLCRAEGDQKAVVEALTNLGMVALSRAESEPAHELLEEALSLTRQSGDRPGQAVCLDLLGRIAHYGRDLTLAARLLEESLELRRGLGDRWGIAQSLSDLADVLAAQGLNEPAHDMHVESLGIWQQIADSWGVAYALEGFAVLKSSTTPDISVRLVGAATAARTRLGIRPLPGRDVELQRVLQACRRALGDARFGAAWQSGQALALDQAAALAVAPSNGSGDGPDEPVRSAHASRPPAGLTGREVEVLVLIARGHSNREIAETLVIAESTAERHIANIFSKVGVTSRARAAIWASEHGLDRPRSNS